MRKVPNMTMCTIGNQDCWMHQVDKWTTHDLERLLEESHDAFAEDERQNGTTPLIKMSTATSDHPPIVKKPYALPSNIMTGSEMKLRATQV